MLGNLVVKMTPDATPNRVICVQLCASSDSRPDRISRIEDV